MNELAGIGFALRKLFDTKSVTSKFAGVLYASFVTIGPVLAFILLLVLVHAGMWFFGIDENTRLMFTTTILYMMVSSVIISCAINTVLSRFIAAQIYDGNNEKIRSSVIGSVSLAAVVSMLAGMAFIYPMVAIYQLSLVYSVGLYLFLLMISITFVLMAYISAIKEYTKVALAYFVGLLFGIAVFLLAYYWLGVPIEVGLIYGMAMTFFVINIALFVLTRTFFKGKSTHSFEFLRFFKKHPALFLSGLFYILGLYAHNIIYWYFSNVSTKVMYLKILPSYDMATFLAMLINLSAMVIFIVKVETSFYEKYQGYVKNVGSANYEEIERSRKNMNRVLDHELFFLYEVQLVITIVLIALGMVFLPRFSFGGAVLDYYMVLGMAYYCSFCMYFTVVFLYYFDDQRGAMITTLLFFAVTAAAGFVIANISPTYFALALLIGALVSWIYGFNRLKSFIRNINRNLFCLNARFTEDKE